MPTKFTGKTLHQWLIEQVGAHDSDECLIWPHGGSHGYGTVKINGKHIPAHALAYKVIHGVLPLPCGLHKCDVRLCFNPRHIFAGTRAANIKDMDAKGRRITLIGESHGRAVLTPEDVVAIRLMFPTRPFREKLIRAVAIRYGVSASTIRWIAQGRSWKHIK